MRTVDSRRRAMTWIAAGAAALLPITATACGDSDNDTSPPTVEVEDVTESDDYFDTDEYIGERVTVNAAVTKVISPNSFEMGGAEWGDESLLVTSAAAVPDLAPGDRVQVTGEVGQFAYADYARDQHLLDAGLYEAYNEEEFLIASSVERSEAADSITGTPAPTG